MATISAVYARIIGRHLLETGAAPDEVFSDTGTDYSGLYDADDIDLDVFRRLLENCDRLLEDPPVGFVIGSHHNTLALGQMGVAMGASPTIREGLQVLESFTRLHTTYIKVSLQSELTHMRVVLDLQEVADNVLRHHVEASLVLFQRYLETLSGRVADDVVYRVSYEEPDYSSRYDDFLHSPTLFGQAFTGLDIPNRWLELRSPYYLSDLYLQSQKDLANQLRMLGQREKSAYSRHVLALLRSHEPPLPNLADIAARLHLSERTLNRRLQSEGTSFRDLRGGVLDDWAKRHLAQTGDSIESIAATLGYQDAANFRRAFRNRSGMTPVQYRDMLALGEAAAV